MLGKKKLNVIKFVNPYESYCFDKSDDVEFKIYNYSDKKTYKIIVEEY